MIYKNTKMFTRKEIVCIALYVCLKYFTFLRQNKSLKNLEYFIYKSSAVN